MKTLNDFGMFPNYHRFFQHNLCLSKGFELELNLCDRPSNGMLRAGDTDCSRIHRITRLHTDVNITLLRGKWWISKHMGPTKHPHAQERLNECWKPRYQENPRELLKVKCGYPLASISLDTLETCYFMQALHVYTHHFFDLRFCHDLHKGRPHAAMDQRSSLEMTPVVGWPVWPHRRPTVSLRSTKRWQQQRHGIDDVAQSYLDWCQWPLNVWKTRVVLVVKIPKSPPQPLNPEESCKIHVFGRDIEEGSRIPNISREWMLGNICETLHQTLEVKLASQRLLPCKQFFCY